MARKPIKITEDEIKKLPKDSLSNVLAKLGLKDHIEKKKTKNEEIESEIKNKTKVKNKKLKKENKDDYIEENEINSDKSKNNEPKTLKELISNKKEKTKKKKQGIDVAPILNSLDNSNPNAEWDDNNLLVDIPGGRILTYNEIYSILQYRKYEAFKYKKICKKVIARALNKKNKNDKPYFDSPTRLTVWRVGTKEMDLDALPVVFKYFIDAFKKEGIIDDDNPNIIVEIKMLQDKGEHRLGLKLEKINNWEKEKILTWEEMIKDIK